MGVTKKALATTAGIGCFAVGAVLGVAQDANAVDFGTSWDTSCPGYASCSLQDLLDGITLSGPGIDTVNDQTGFDLFTNTATGSSMGSFMFEVAGFAGTNKFGIYNASGDKALLFEGNNDGGDRVVVDFLAGGDLSISTKGFAPGYTGSTIDRSYSAFGNLFGFYLERGDGTTFYSQNAKNQDGYQQSVIYQGDNATTLALPGKQPGLFTDNEFIIAFEDLWRGGSSDGDFNDLVVMMESIQPADVPEPATLLGLGVVTAGLAFKSRRKSEKTS